MYPNVLFNKSGYSWRYLLTHPHELIKTGWRNLRFGWQRATRGWADCDWWDMDGWFIEVLPPMLRAMADKGYAYPGCEPFETPEKWHDWLYLMADEISKCTEEYMDSQNEYYKKWEKTIFASSVTKEEKEKDDKLSNKYMARSDELYKEAEKRIANVFTELGENFYCLWD